MQDILELCLCWSLIKILSLWKPCPWSKVTSRWRYPYPNITEPGAHLFSFFGASYRKGSEHLPQISIGKTWVSNGSERNMSLKINSLVDVNSATPITVALDTKSKSGTAKIFVIDEGIHALTGYQNKNLKDHFLSERALNFGIFTNFGQLISQNSDLSTLRVGGDGDMLSAAAAADKSEFFKTVTYASPLLDIQNGQAEFTFPPTIEWEGKLRVVAFSIDDRGFGSRRIYDSSRSSQYRCIDA